jgi:hypothetical protein
VLVRADSAGSAKAFLTHIRALRSRGTRVSFSVGWSITESVRRAIRQLPEQVWHPALEQDGSLRKGAQVAELTGLIDLPGCPEGTRIIVRRERPHPGAQLSLFDLDEGMRHQVFLTDTPVAGGGSIQHLEVRHRAHARIEEQPTSTAHENQPNSTAPTETARLALRFRGRMLRGIGDDKTRGS